jgi:hypothetical protein
MNNDMYSKQHRMTIGKDGGTVFLEWMKYMEWYGRNVVNDAGIYASSECEYRL